MTDLRLYYWRSRSHAPNFGDELSPLVVRHVTGRRVHWAPHYLADLFAIGSILHRALARRTRLFNQARHLFGAARPMVWGSGLLESLPGVDAAHLDILAVRGPRTADILGPRERLAFGDPALFVAEMFQERRKRFQVGLVPHYSQRDDPLIRQALERHPHWREISVSDEPMEVVRAISECEVILSSSLHGLIIADALGIPNFRLRTSSDLKGGSFKFEDHWAALGRTRAESMDGVAFDADRDIYDGDFAYQSGIPILIERLTRVLRERLQSP